MKKTLFILCMLAMWFAGKAQQTYPNYQDINQGYKWRRGIFDGLGLPAGDSARFTDTRALKRAGSVFYDSVDNSTPAGLYIYNGTTWELLIGDGGGGTIIPSTKFIVGSGSDQIASIRDSITAGATEMYISGTVKISAPLTLPVGVKLIGINNAVLELTSDTAAIIISGNNMIKDLTIKGDGFSAYEANDIGIRMIGTSGTYKKGLVLENVNIMRFGGYGLFAEYAQDIVWKGGKIDTIGYAGVGAFSVTNALFDDIKIDSVGPGSSSNAYGMFFNRRGTTSSLTDYPRPKNIVVQNCTITGISVWEGLDTHAGDGIVFRNNRISGTKRGIVFSPSHATGNESDDDYAPINSMAEGNYVEGLSTGEGIVISGADSSAVLKEYAQNIKLIGNTIVNAGISQDGTFGGAIVSKYSTGTVIANNTLKGSYVFGINMYAFNENFSISGNSILDVGDNGVTNLNPSGIVSRSTNNRGFIGGNTIYRQLLTDRTYDLTYGVRVYSQTGVNLIMGNNNFIAVGTHYLGTDNSTTSFLKVDNSNVYSGAGSPEGSYTANAGSIYIRNDNVDSILYVKTTTSGSTGWKVIHAGTQPQSTVVGLVDSVSAHRTDINSKVPTLRQISTSTGLSGGGDLSANRTLSVDTSLLSTWYYRQGVLNTILALKIDSVKSVNDSLFFYKGGTKVYSGLTTIAYIINGGNSISHLSIGTNDNAQIRFKTNGITHSRVTEAGLWLYGLSSSIGDYRHQVLGGVYADITGKTWRVVGLGTDNNTSSNQILARKSNGDFALRDVSSILDELGSLFYDSTYDKLIDIVNTNDVKIKSIRVRAGANITVNKTINGSGSSVDYEIVGAASGGSGANTALSNLSAVAINAALLAGSNNAIALGSASFQWSDLFLGSGGIIDWNNGDVQLIHGTNNLALTGGNFTADIAPESTVGGTGLVVGTSNAQTVSNKRWVPRVVSTTSSSTPTINTDVTDIYKLTAQSANITSFTTNLTGTPNDGEILEIQITGTAARAITWGSSFVASTVALPTTTVTTTTLTVVFQYYTTSSYGNNKWVCVHSY